MHEFEERPLDFLKSSIKELKAYKQGVEDTINIILDDHRSLLERTLHFYDSKIELCQQEIDKLEGKNS